MSLLEQDTIKKGQVKTAIELDKGNNKEYKVKTIYDSKVYAKKFDNSHYLLDRYYLV